MFFVFCSNTIVVVTVQLVTLLWVNAMLATFPQFDVQKVAKVLKSQERRVNWSLHWETAVCCAAYDSNTLRWPWTSLSIRLSIEHWIFLREASLCPKTLLTSQFKHIASIHVGLLKFYRVKRLFSFIKTKDFCFLQLTWSSLASHSGKSLSPTQIWWGNIDFYQ